MMKNNHVHTNEVLDVEVVQRRHVRVFSCVRLQNQLLDDPVQQNPVLKAAAVLLIWGHTARVSGQEKLLSRVGSRVLQGIMRQCCSTDSR